MSEGERSSAEQPEDAEQMTASDLRRSLKTIVPTAPDDGARLGRTIKERRHIARSRIAYALVGLYIFIAALSLVSIVAGWSTFGELKDLLALTYGSLTGLVGAALGLVARKTD